MRNFLNKILKPFLNIGSSFLLYPVRDPDSNTFSFLVIPNDWRRRTLARRLSFTTYPLAYNPEEHIRNYLLVTPAIKSWSNPFPWNLTWRASGVSPVFRFRLGSAPVDIRTFIISGWPRAAAMCKGVSPIRLDGMFRFNPRLHKISIEYNS